MAQNPLTKKNKRKHFMQNGCVVEGFSENVHGAKGKGQKGAKMA